MEPHYYDPYPGWRDLRAADIVPWRVLSPEGELLGTFQQDNPQDAAMAYVYQTFADDSDVVRNEQTVELVVEYDGKRHHVGMCPTHEETTYGVEVFWSHLERKL